MTVSQMDGQLSPNPAVDLPGPMASSRTSLLVVIPIVTFVLVTLAVTSALEDVIFFFLLLGIPTGPLAAGTVWSVLHIFFRSGNGLP